MTLTLQDLGDWLRVTSLTVREIRICVQQSDLGPVLLGVCVFDWTLVWLVFLKSSGHLGSHGDDKGKEKLHT